MSLFTKKAYVGLDIGHHTLRAVQVERTTSGWRVAKSASAPTPDDTVRDGVVIDPAILGLAIKNLLKSAHISATSASIAISGGTVVVRPIRLPKMAESALRKSIRFEASRYVPNSVEDSYIEFEIIGDVDATNMDVIIAAAPKELVDSRVAACEQAGLEVEHVEIASFAAYRSIVEADHGHDWADKTVGLVDIGAAVTNLGVISNGAFSMTRAIPAGGQVLTDALKSYFKLSTEDAESGKSQLDIRGLLNEASVAENPPLRILHTHVDDLVREVRRSINYWQSQQSEAASAKHVDVIVLCGGGSNLPGLSEYFQHKLGIETLALGVFDNPRFLPSYSDSGHGMDMAVAVGLAMGLAPSHAVVRDPKPAPAVEAKNAKPPKPPKDPKPPKPPKPSKGRTFKVSRPTEAPVEEVETIPSTEDVEIAAFMPTEHVALPATVPLVAEAASEEPVSAMPPAVELPEVPIAHAPIQELEVSETPIESAAPDQAETFEAPAIMTAMEEVAPAAAEVSQVVTNVEAKYGPELAALVGAFESDPVDQMPEPSAAEANPPAKEFDEIVQPRSASQRMASRAPSTPAPAEAPEASEACETPVAQESIDFPAAEATPVVEMPPAQTPVAEIPPVPVAMEMADTEMSRLPDEPTAEAPAQLEAPAPAMPAAEVKLMQEPVAQIQPPSMMVDEPEANALRSALLSDPVASTLNVPARAFQAEKSKKPLFSRTPKAEKVSKSPQPHADNEAQPASPLKKAASWLFGGQKEHVKPTGILTPRGEASGTGLNPTTVASRDSQIELLRGSSLEPVDTTMSAEKPEVPAPRPEPEVVTEMEPPKAKARKTAPAKKAEATDPDSDSKKEAA